MPSIGAKVKTTEHFISVKAYKDNPDVDFSQIKETLQEAVRSAVGNDIREIAEFVATTIQDKMFLDLKVPFYEVEVLSAEGHLYSTIRMDEDSL